MYASWLTYISTHTTFKCFRCTSELHGNMCYWLQFLFTNYVAVPFDRFLEIFESFVLETNFNDL